MEFRHFEIENFRGINKVRLNLTSSPKSRVFALVGLNESGKTTILEAINHFTFKVESLAPLELPGYAIKDPHTLIPIAKRANFNGSVIIKVGLTFSDEDWSKLKSQVQKEMGFKLTKKIRDFEVSQKIVFKNSKHDVAASTNTFDLSFHGESKEGKKSYLHGEEWKKVAAFINPMMPSILFFPNFLFEFPDRIYLEDIGVEDEKHAFYRLVLQDILDSLNNRLILKTHILDRAKSGDTQDKKALEGLLLEMGRNVSGTVFDAWNKILGRRTTFKRIIIDCDKDEAGNVYLQFKLEDTDGFYLINERSLGFRWFFVFLLLTQYRGFRKQSTGNVLFLFDEPASNLHPSAQAQLLESFRRLGQSCRIIYTTHSHHLINPEWLESTFVVKNEGLHLTDQDTETYSAKKTSIVATRYREFVVTYPDQSDYYRPILDVLDYAPSKLENVPDVVMVEGKNDFYTLQFMQTVVLNQTPRINLLPGTSSGSLDSLIRLYSAWGKQFLVLLDADQEGARQKERYEKLFETLVQGRIFTLKEIDPTWTSHEMETLFSDSEKLAIQTTAYPGETQFNKTHFNRAVQEHLLTRKVVSISTETRAKFQKILSFVVTKFSVLHNK